MVRIYRNGGTTPIAQIPVHVLFWRKPIVNFVDDSPGRGRTPDLHGRRHRATPTCVSPKSPASAAVTVGIDHAVRNGGRRRHPVVLLAAQRCLPGPSWPVTRRAPPTAASTSRSAPRRATARPAPPSATRSTAVAFDGSTEFLSSSQAVPSPTTYSVETWIKTSTTSGGKIIGFGDNQGGLDFGGNPQHERQLRQAHLHDQRRPPDVRCLQRRRRHADVAERLQRRSVAPPRRHAGPGRHVVLRRRHPRRSQRRHHQPGLQRLLAGRR